MNFIILPPLIFIATYISGIIYAKLFKKFNSSKKNVPTGFGYILILIITSSLFFFQDQIYIQTVLPSLILINISALFYYSDDLFNLNPWIRTLIIVLTSLIILFLNYSELNFLSNTIELILFNFIFISISFLIVNVLNFYDGSDLNLASIILLIGIILIFFSDNSSFYLKRIGLTLSSSILGFGIINYKPKKLYLGDSGSFGIAFLFIILMRSSYLNSIPIFCALISLISFPIFDVLYVLLIRVRLSHNLLSRNFLHLYQRIQIIYGGFYYLLPVPLNMIYILIITKILKEIGINHIKATLISTIFITPINYLLIRYKYIERNYFFNDGKINK